MIYHFYHCFSAGEWQKPFEEHIAALVDSGLYENIDDFFVGIVGSKNEYLNTIEFLNNKGIKFSVSAHAEFGYEQVTHQALYDFAQNNDGNVLYAHTKGAANVDLFRDNWRRTMTHYNINLWRDNIELLQTYDTVGWDLRRTQYVFYAGNFWWTKLSVIRELDPPLWGDRWSPEYWLWSQKRYFNMYSWS